MPPCREVREGGWRGQGKAAMRSGRRDERERSIELRLRKLLDERPRRPDQERPHRLARIDFLEKRPVYRELRRIGARRRLAGTGHAGVALEVGEEDFAFEHREAVDLARDRALAAFAPE